MTYLSNRKIDMNMEKQNWTMDSVGDLSSKTMIVTGGNSGLGLSAVKALTAKGANVIMASRSIQKAEEARSEILKTNPNAKIDVMELNLADLSSIHNFSSQFHKRYSKLDILFNNAGIMMVPYGLTKDGFEKQIGTNHLGHFALTGLLLDVLKSTPRSRVVTVSSLAHKRGEINTDDLLFENGKGYSPMTAYGRSKLSNLLFAYELQRFFETNKIDCMSLSAHPGVSDTNLFNHAMPKWSLKTVKPMAALFIQPATMGVLPELRAGLDIQAKGGQFYGPDGHREIKGYPVPVESTKASHNQEDARKLWEISEKLTGVVYK